MYMFTYPQQQFTLSIAENVTLTKVLLKSPQKTFIYSYKGLECRCMKWERAHRNITWGTEYRNVQQGLKDRTVRWELECRNVKHIYVHD